MPRTTVRVVRLPIWSVVVAAALLLAILVVAAVVAAGLFVILFPIMLAAVAILALLGWPGMRRQDQTRGTGAIIETDYAVLDEEGSDQRTIDGKGGSRKDKPGAGP